MEGVSLRRGVRYPPSSPTFPVFSQEGEERIDSLLCELRRRSSRPGPASGSGSAFSLHSLRGPCSLASPSLPTYEDFLRLTYGGEPGVNRLPPPLPCPPPPPLSPPPPLPSLLSRKAFSSWAIGQPYSVSSWSSSSSFVDSSFSGRQPMDGAFPANQSHHSAPFPARKRFAFIEVNDNEIDDGEEGESRGFALTNSRLPLQEAPLPTPRSFSNLPPVQLVLPSYSHLQQSRLFESKMVADCSDGRTAIGVPCRVNSRQPSLNSAVSSRSVVSVGAESGEGERRDTDGERAGERRDANWERAGDRRDADGERFFAESPLQWPRQLESDQPVRLCRRKARDSRRRAIAQASSSSIAAEEEPSPQSLYRIWTEEEAERREGGERGRHSEEEAERRGGGGRGRHSRHPRCPVPFNPSKSSALSGEMRRQQRPKSYVLATSFSFPTDDSDPRLPSRSQTSPTSPTSSFGGVPRGRASVVVERSWDQCGDSLLSPSVSAPSATANATASPRTTAANTQRLHKLLALFSHHHENNNKAATSRGPVRRSRTAGTRDRIPLPILPPVPTARVTKQGPLVHQELPLGSGSSKNRAAASSWQECWAVLSGAQLFLCPQLSSFGSDSLSQKMLSIPSDAVCVDVEGSLTDIAYECLLRKNSGKRRHVFRIVSQKRTEHLLQAAREEEMLEWIECIQAATSPAKENSVSVPADSLQEDEKSKEERERRAADPAGTVPPPASPPSTQLLIMQRYKAKASQLGSPLSSKRSGGSSYETASSSTASSSSRVAPAPSSTAHSGGSTHANGSGEGGTPKSARRWKKGKASKQPSISHGSGGQVHAAFGSKITDCTTGGEGDLVPLLVRVCVRVVEAHGMDTVGIYRIPGNTAAVNALKDGLNDGFDAMDFTDSRWKDVNVVSSLLKMFLRKLPEPLLTDKLYPFFIDANRIAVHHSRLHKLRNLLRKLPRAHFVTLKFIMGHLSKVTAHSHVNKMETRNLALMFGPSIVRPSDDSMATMVTHMSDQCKIIETFVNYFEWMFDESGTAEDAVPVQLASDATPLPQSSASLDSGGAPVGVSSTSFNDMHSLIIRANEEQAVAMMKENDRGKIKSILNVRRNSRRDKSKWKQTKVESQAASVVAADEERQGHPPPSKQTTTRSSVDSTFCGQFQERDIDAEIASRGAAGPSTSTALTQSETTSVEGGEEREGEEETREGSSYSLELSPSAESVETARSEGSSEQRKKRHETLSSARRIFIAGSEAAASASLSSEAAMDALRSHTQHLHIAASPALDCYSAETREKIKRMQLLGTAAWKHFDKTTSSPTKEDALSCTSDYSTTSSAPMGVVVASEGGALSSDYASSDVSPCTRSSPLPRPHALPLASSASPSSLNNLPPPTKPPEVTLRMARRQRRDIRRHTLADVQAVEKALEAERGGPRGESKQGESLSTRSKLARWLRGGLRKSSPDLRATPLTLPMHSTLHSIPSGDNDLPLSSPPRIVRTSPNELTPASGDEQL